MDDSVTVMAMINIIVGYRNISFLGSPFLSFLLVVIIVVILIYRLFILCTTRGWVVVVVSADVRLCFFLSCCFMDLVLLFGRKDGGK